MDTCSSEEGRGDALCVKSGVAATLRHDQAACNRLGTHNRHARSLFVQTSQMRRAPLWRRPRTRARNGEPEHTSDVRGDLFVVLASLCPQLVALARSEPDMELVGLPAHRFLTQCLRWSKHAEATSADVRREKGTFASYIGTNDRRVESEQSMANVRQRMSFCGIAVSTEPRLDVRALRTCARSLSTMADGAQRLGAPLQPSRNGGEVRVSPNEPSSGREVPSEVFEGEARNPRRRQLG